MNGSAPKTWAHTWMASADLDQKVSSQKEQETASMSSWKVSTWSHKSSLLRNDALQPAASQRHVFEVFLENVWRVERQGKKTLNSHESKQGKERELDT
jgi:hypothetical protein